MEASFNYVTSTQPLHLDDAEQTPGPSLPGPNGERSPRASNHRVLLNPGWARPVWPGGSQDCCDSLFNLITPNSWPLEFVSLTLMVVELDLSASHSITVLP